MYEAIGLMSGTTMDGLDICPASFEKNTGGTWNYQILNAETIPYSPTWEKQLRNAIHLSSEDLLALHTAYGFFLGETTKAFIDRHQLTDIDVVSSHGHTVFHQPQRKFTLQIGDGRAIKIVNKIPVVYDFRSQDVLLGGNGAPLVPIGDELIFSEFDACLNIGGFSNISFKKDGQRIGFDICPVNIVLNALSQKLGKTYDENGSFARTGVVDEEMLSILNSLNYYQQDAPKSLGIEWVMQNISPLWSDDSAANHLATFTEHAAHQIAETLNRHQFRNVLFTGGGTYNSYLVECIEAKTSAEIIIPDNPVINYKEALIFALMGVLRMNNEINVLASATGSLADHCSGLLV